MNILKNNTMYRWLAILTPFFLTSCYSISIASQYLCLVSKGKSFQQVEQPSEQEQQFFARVVRINAFVKNQLGLRPTQNYRRYVRLERNYLTAVVSAAPELSFEDYLWSYPFVGKLPYRGYFDVPKAQKEAARLEELGYDVFVRPVDAFSTLGYLRDPLFSYMVEYSEAKLANLIIHESFHSTLFVPGDIAFNESLANLVGQYGSHLYMRQQYGSEWEHQRKDQQAQDQQENKQFRSMVLQLKNNLSEIYSDNNRSRKQRLQAKQNTIKHWQQQFLPPQYQQHFVSKRYEYIAQYPINNAYLALFSLYEDPDNFLDSIYQQFLQKQKQGTAQTKELTALQQFISLCRKLGAKHRRQTRQALKEYAAKFEKES